jgi:hypothetical protein
MTHVFRLTTGLALVGLALAAAWWLRPALLEGAGLDLWDLPQWQGALAAESDRGEWLDQSFADLYRRREAKTWVCRELIAGRIPLADAAHRVLDLTTEREKLWKFARLQCSGDTDEECLERYVIEIACDLLKDEPARAEQLRQRLQAEIRST